MRNFKRIILYITISFLILTGSFLCFSKTVNANNRVYVYNNYSSDDENIQKMMEYYREYEKQKEEEEKKQAEEKAKSNKPKPGDFAALFGVFAVLALCANSFFNI